MKGDYPTVITVNFFVEEDIKLLQKPMQAKFNRITSCQCSKEHLLKSQWNIFWPPMTISTEIFVKMPKKRKETEKRCVWWIWLFNLINYKTSFLDEGIKTTESYVNIVHMKFSVHVVFSSKGTMLWAFAHTICKLWWRNGHSVACRKVSLCHRDPWTTLSSNQAWVSLIS